MIDYKNIAESVGVEPAVIRAVAEVESSGNGFLDSGEPKILFEPHVYWRCLVRRGIDPKQFVEGNEDILYSKWKQGAYGKISEQHSRLQRAVKMNREAALEACSWGSFQVLGENWEWLGYKSIQDFVNDAYTEEGQVRMFVKFITKKGLIPLLKRKDFKNFALKYNGAGAAKNKYAEKMQSLYNIYK